jgi:hypothetical protein
MYRPRTRVQAIDNGGVMIIVLNQEWHHPDSKSWHSRWRGAESASGQAVSRERDIVLESLIAHGPNTTRDIRYT